VDLAALRNHDAPDLFMEAQGNERRGAHVLRVKGLLANLAERKTGNFIFSHRDGGSCRVDLLELLKVAQKMAGIGRQPADPRLAPHARYSSAEGTRALALEAIMGNPAARRHPRDAHLRPVQPRGGAGRHQYGWTRLRFRLAFRAAADEVPYPAISG